jgi:hypothetical protein
MDGPNVSRDLGIDWGVEGETSRTCGRVCRVRDPAGMTRLKGTSELHRQLGY